LVFLVDIIWIRLYAHSRFKLFQILMLMLMLMLHLFWSCIRLD